MTVIHSSFRPNLLKRERGGISSINAHFIKIDSAAVVVLLNHPTAILNITVKQAKKYRILTVFFRWPMAELCTGNKNALVILISSHQKMLWYPGDSSKIDKSAIMSVKNEIQLKHKKNGYLQFLGIFFICGVAVTLLLFIYMLLQPV